MIGFHKAGHTGEEIGALTGLSRIGVFDRCKLQEAADAMAPPDAPARRLLGDGRRPDAVQETEVRELITDRAGPVEDA